MRDCRLKAEVLGRDRNLLASASGGPGRPAGCRSCWSSSAPSSRKNGSAKRFLHDTFRQMESEGALQARG